MPYYAAAKRMAAARAAAMAQQEELWKKAQSGAIRLNAAEDAYANDNIDLAAKLYVSLARSRPKTPVNDKALQRLQALADEARQKLTETDEALEQCASRMSASDWRYEDSWPADLPEKINDAFQQYEQIVDQYGAVPAVRSELKSHVAAQRRHRYYSAVLNEPEAKTLLQLARQHEEEDRLCCAFWVYDDASKLAPAPSAEVAAKRLAEMNRDPEIVAAAERCRKLQWCHRQYNHAEKLAKVRPEKAREYYQEILENSPTDSEVHKAARNRLAEMTR